MQVQLAVARLDGRGSSNGADLLSLGLEDNKKMVTSQRSSIGPLENPAHLAPKLSWEYADNFYPKKEDTFKERVRRPSFLPLITPPSSSELSLACKERLPLVPIQNQLVGDGEPAREACLFLRDGQR